MNQELKKHVHDALSKNIRFDRRKHLDFRDLTVETGFLSTAEGSARVKCGNTEIVAGVKLSVGTPYPDSPDEGTLMVNAELLPLSNPEFESGPPGIDAIEASRVIDRGLRESRIIDTKKLCIEEGERVWMVAIDIVPINFDGNLIDIGGLAALLALKDTKLPKYTKKDGVDYENKTDKGIPMEKDDPLPVTVCKIGKTLLVDPLEREEAALDARLTVTTAKSGEVVAMQKGGDHALSIDEINQMVDIAIKKSKELRKHLK